MERANGISEMNAEDFQVGIVGKGKMGTSIFHYLLDFDFPLVWVCKTKNDVEELEKQVTKKWMRRFRAGVIDHDRYENRLNQIRVSHLPQQLAQCNLIIETIPEDPGMKRKLFETLDRIVNSNCIFSSCSSSILPEEWYPDGKRKDKAIGMHFVYPVPFTNIVELIITGKTSRHTLQRAQLFLNHINRTFILQQGESSFLLNRVFLDFQAGAYRVCMENNLTFSGMDDLIVKNFFPVGVFEFFDRTGIDVIHHSIDRYTKKAKNREFYEPLLNHLRKLLKENRLGMKTAGGFYDWNAQQKVIPVDNNQKSKPGMLDGSIIEQLKYWYVDAAIRFVELGYCTKEELTFGIKEYMNCEKGPFEM